MIMDKCNVKTILSFHINAIFVDQHHEHILSGSFEIIRDNELEKIFTNRPKYEEKKIISFEKAKFNIIADMNDSNEV